MRRIDALEVGTLVYDPENNQYSVVTRCCHETKYYKFLGQTVLDDLGYDIADAVYVDDLAEDHLACCG